MIFKKKILSLLLCSILIWPTVLSSNSIGSDQGIPLQDEYGDMNETRYENGQINYYQDGKLVGSIPESELLESSKRIKRQLSGNDQNFIPVIGSESSIIVTDGFGPIVKEGTGGVDVGDGPLHYSNGPFGERFGNPKTHELLFEDDFDDCYMTDWRPDFESGPPAQASGGAKVGTALIYAGNPWVTICDIDAADGGAWAFSRYIDFYDISDYTIQVKFAIRTQDNHWIPAIDNQEIWVGIDRGNDLKYYSKQNNPTATFIMDLEYPTPPETTPIWYHIQVHYKESIDMYDIYVWKEGETPPTVPTVNNAKRMDPLITEPTQYLIIGDIETGTSNYGDNIVYDDVKFWGYSESQFHDNFDDQSIIDWDVHGYGQGYLIQENDRLYMHSPNDADMAIGNSLFIDYNSRTTPNVDEDYIISTYFMIPSDSPYPHWFRVIYNNQIEVALHSTGSVIQLRLLEPTHTPTLMAVQKNRWYSLIIDADVSAGTYKVRVDGETQYDSGLQRNYFYFLNSNAYDYINLGDVGTGNGRGYLYWDHLKLLGAMYDDKDSDQDGLSDHFEFDPNLDNTYFMIYSDGMETYRWFNPWVAWNGPFYPWYSGKPDPQWGWKDTNWKLSVPSGGYGHDHSAMAYETNPGGHAQLDYYMALGEILCTPKIHIDATSYISLSWYQRYDFATSIDGQIKYDGGQVLLMKDLSFKTAQGDNSVSEYFDQTEWSDIGNEYNLYNGQIAAGNGNPLGGSYAFVGESLNWQKKECKGISISSSWAIVLGFMFGTRVHPDNPSDFGWIIDDLKIFGSTDPSNPDTDGDGLSDGEEYYKYCTSPITKDTDGDDYSDDSWDENHDFNPLYPDLYIEFTSMWANFGPFIWSSAAYVIDYFKDLDIHAVYTYRSIAQQTIINDCSLIDDYNDLIVLDKTERIQIESHYHMDSKRVFIFFCEDVLDDFSNKRAGISGQDSGGFIAMHFLTYKYYTKYKTEIAKALSNFIDNIEFENIQRKYILHELGHCLHMGLFDDIFDKEIYSGYSNDVTPPDSHSITTGYWITGRSRKVDIDEWSIMSRPSEISPYYNELLGAFSIQHCQYESEEVYSSWLIHKYSCDSSH